MRPDDDEAPSGGYCKLVGGLCVAQMRMQGGDSLSKHSELGPIMQTALVGAVSLRMFRSALGV